MSEIKDFYLNKSPNPHGLYLKDIWNFSEWEFDNTHDFIQWMFPLEMQSRHSKTAPIITKEVLEEMLSDQVVVNNLIRSLYKAENFWGFDVVHKKVNRSRPRDFRVFHELNWPAKYHHNYIRIARVLHCLKLFKLDSEAHELMDYLESKVYCIYENIVGEETIKSWRSAYDFEVTFEEAS